VARTLDLRTDRSRAADDPIRCGDRSDDRDVVITACGRLCLHRKRINISTVLAGQKLGIKEVDEGIWLVSFMHYDLGYFDLEQKTLQPLDNPFGTRLSPMSQVRSVTHVSGPDKFWTGGAGGIRTLDRALQPYNGLANRRLQPLGHSSGLVFSTT
jgi:hypothetical protein